MPSAVSATFSMIDHTLCQRESHAYRHGPWLTEPQRMTVICCRLCARRACCWRASTAAARGTAWGARASGAPRAPMRRPPCPARRGRAPPHHRSQYQTVLPRLLVQDPPRRTGQTVHRRPRDQKVLPHLLVQAPGHRLIMRKRTSAGSCSTGRKRCAMPRRWTWWVCGADGTMWQPARLYRPCHTE